MVKIAEISVHRHQARGVFKDGATSPGWMGDSESVFHYSLDPRPDGFYKDHLDAEWDLMILLYDPPTD
jgi:hypothetical protein